MARAQRHDVVVVGGGGAGMAAAMAAAEAGADVALLQKESTLGGVTGVANGIIAAAGTHVQERVGIDDTWEYHFEDVGKFVESHTKPASRSHLHHFEGDLRAKDNLTLRELMTREAGATVDWLHGQGCTYIGPFAEGHHRVPRLQIIENDYVSVLGDRLGDLDVSVHLDTAVTELEQDETGRVTGVTAERGGRAVSVIAEAAVILATGSYINAPEWGEIWGTSFVGDVDLEAIYTANRGDGHRMAAEAGAELRNMDMVDFYFRFTPPLWTGANFPAMVDRGAIIVNADGERFVDETVEYDQLLSSAARQPDDEIYVIFDEEIAGEFQSWPDYVATYVDQPWGFIDDYLETDHLVREHSPAALAGAAGFDADTFGRTVAEWNTGVHLERGGHVDRFGREAGHKPLTEYPLYAMGPLQAYQVVTHGGAAVDDSLRVLDEAGDVIPGLHAAGVVAGDLHLFGHGHNHCWVFTSGRLAGEAAAG